MPSSGVLARISRAARAPSSVRSGGIRMSMMARSGRASQHGGHQRRRVAGRGDDVVPGVGEQAGQALPEQRGVLADHDAHGSTASTTVPRPAGLSTSSVPPAAATRSASPASPAPGPDRGAAAAVVADPHGQPSVVARDPEADPRRDACLTALVIASLATKYAVVATSSGSVPGADVSVDRHRRRPAARRDSAGPSPSSRLLGRRPCAIWRSSATAVASSATAESSRPSTSTVPSSRWRWASRSAMPERDQPLLGAVVQVALEAAALGVADLQQPGAAGLGLGQRPAPARAAARRPRPAAPAASAISRSSSRVPAVAAQQHADLPPVAHAPAPAVASPATSNTFCAAAGLTQLPYC